MLVICGGAAGVAARAALTVPFSAGAHPLLVPALTLVINLAGALLLGVVVGALDDRHPRWRSFLGTGVLGGFTTYSAFAVHVVTMGSSAPLVGLVLAAVTIFGGALAAAAGLGLGRRIAGRPGEIESPEEAE
ncbi:MAG: CrcB family protein [Microbacterium sp.]|nr:CrcB family protein [Microbacterium sp.]